MKDQKIQNKKNYNVLFIKERSISRPFSYVKHHRDNDTLEGQRYNDRDNEEGQPSGSYFYMLKNAFHIV